MTSRFQLKEINNVNDALFQDAFLIYKNAFPPELLQEMEVFARILQTKELGQDRHIIVAMLNKKVIGMATLNYFYSTNTGCVGYIVIGPEWQKKGFGTRLYNGLVENLSQDAKRQGKLGPDALFFEVEKSEFAKTDAEKQRDLERIRFFRSVGCKIIKAKYFQPSLGPGLDSVELNLMVRILNPKLELNKEWLIKAVDSIYKYIYVIESNLLPGEKNKYLEVLALSVSGDKPEID
jgi:GNAT superfamily N-acetyltransferase